LLERERPSLVLAYTIKPIVLGIPAASRAGVPKRYALITGLGAAFNTPGIKGWLLRKAASAMYRSALNLCTKVIVQNRDIEGVLRREGILSEGVAVSVVPGSGIDTERFKASAIPAGPPVYLLLARMLVDKGIREFVEAARIVRQECAGARFLLVGGLDTNPSAIPKAELDRWNKQGVVECRPAVVDVRPLLMQCSIYVLPSYHEGLPRSVLEAMSVGRPVITTDAIGCRDTILEPGPIDAEGVRTGKNGMLVPVRNVPALAAAMLRLAGNPQIAESMGRSGRAAAELLFDVRRINDLMLGAMGVLAPQEGQAPIAESS
jgi:glycosyltransferase involved in cell wall biosynthesis